MGAFSLIVVINLLNRFVLSTAANMQRGKLPSIVSAKWLAENWKYSNQSKMHVIQSIYEPPSSAIGSSRLKRPPIAPWVLHGMPLSARNTSWEYRDTSRPTVASSVNLYEMVNTNAEMPLTVPTAEQFSEYASKKGINIDDHLVIYDEDPTLAFHYSTCRTWLLFKIFGHEGPLSILHGGLKSWIEIGGEVTDEIPEVEETDYKAKLDEKMLVRYEAILQNSKSNNSQFQLIDARGKDGFDGGNVPGATNVPFSEFYAEDGSFKNVFQLEDVFFKRGVDLHKPTVSMCRGGISACMLTFAAYQLGAKVPFYDGSWAEIQHKGGLK